MMSTFQENGCVSRMISSSQPCGFVGTTVWLINLWESAQFRKAALFAKEKPLEKKSIVFRSTNILRHQCIEHHLGDWLAMQQKTRSFPVWPGRNWEGQWTAGRCVRYPQGLGRHGPPVMLPHCKSYSYKALYLYWLVVSNMFYFP